VCRLRGEWAFGAGLPELPARRCRRLCRAPERRPPPAPGDPERLPGRNRHRPGQDYTAAIIRALDGCDAVLVVIGPGWHAATTPQGTPRLFEADDYVRLEVSRALHRDVPVIPVLVGGARLPAAAELPDDLQGLIHRQAVVLHDETWHQDLEGLLGSLRGQPAVPARARRRWLVPAGVAVGLIVLIGLGAAAGWWGPGSGGASGAGDQTGSEAGVLACAPPKGQGWRPITLNHDPTGEEKLSNGSLVFKVKDAYRRGREGKWQVILATSMHNATSGPEYHGTGGTARWSSASGRSKRRALRQPPSW
jgi:hypothetical protein